MWWASHVVFWDIAHFEFGVMIQNLLRWEHNSRSGLYHESNRNNSSQ